jgi:hypothetical protein
MSGEVQVRIRHAEEARAVPLTIWPLSDLEGVVRHLRHWGVYDEAADDAELVGQFVIEGDTAYFEVIVGGE